MELPIYDRKECAASSKMGKGSDGLRVLGSRVRLQGRWHGTDRYYGAYALPCRIPLRNSFTRTIPF